MHERHPDSAQPALHTVEMGRGLVGQVVDRAGCSRDHRRVLSPLRVEHAQRVRLERDLALL